MIFCKKLSDGTANWQHNDVNVRFQKSNECDFIIFNGEKLLMLEAKAHKGKSIPLNCIRESQVKGLIERSIYSNVICGLLILFSDVEQAYFLNIHEFEKYLRTSVKKSIPISYLEEYGVKIDIRKKVKNYDVNIADIFEKNS
jgi:recombination protein U